ncbi:lipase [Russula ochroleuca]|uniref:Lipase n=1 Tax=Russula ochroleuca TaxID=152965 RepID=A0A9P5JYX4_9AGAM|nr:lipase [Russula ochroleuca]
MVSFLCLFALASAVLVRATAISVKRQAIAPLSSTQIGVFAPFTHLASAAYCDPSTTRTWTCGANCQAVPDFQPVAAGGDGSDTQFWYVGSSNSLNTVIVAHQGTNPHQLLALLTDADFFLKQLDTSLFPGIPSSVEAHSGFVDEQAKTASEILFHVQNTLSTQGLSSVTVVGHSLGGALALLDGVYLSLQLPKTVAVKVISYGMPRVGNQAFANFVDSQLSGVVTHINNEEDPIPIVPGRTLGFHHPSGEIHIQDSGVWDACPGQDNPSQLCIVGDVNNIFEGNLNDHTGPYAGITMGC